MKAVVLSLGSNTTADFQQALAALAHFGELTASDVVSGADFTGRSRRIYHNLCVKLLLHTPQDVSQFCVQLKAIEQACGRDHTRKSAAFDYEVAMDIDLLAWQTADGWQMNARRMPLKAHDAAGVRQVAAFLLDY